MKRPSEAHLLMEKYLAELGLGCETEVLFHPTRKFRFDFAARAITKGRVDRGVWSARDIKLAVEIDGGVWLPKGRHTTGKGFIRDAIKRNEAQILGWDVLVFTPSQVLSGEAKETIRRWLESR